MAHAAHSADCCSQIGIHERSLATSCRLGKVPPLCPLFLHFGEIVGFGVVLDEVVEDFGDAASNTASARSQF